MQLFRDGFPVLGSQFSVLRGMYVDRFVQTHFLLRGSQNFTLRKLLMTNHVGHMTYQSPNFQYVSTKLQDYFACIDKSKTSICVTTAINFNASRFPTSSVFSYSFNFHLGLRSFLDTFIICEYM